MRPVGDFLGARAVENLFLYIGVHERGAFLAPDAHGVFDGLVGDLLVALADDDVDRRLAADELRQRRDHDRVAELGAHLRGFLQGLIQLVLHADAAQLMAQIGNHAAGNLVHILRIIVFRSFADRQIVLLCAGREMIAPRRGVALHRSWS